MTRAPRKPRGPDAKALAARDALRAEGIALTSDQCLLRGKLLRRLAADLGPDKVRALRLPGK